MIKNGNNHEQQTFFIKLLEFLSHGFCREPRSDQAASPVFAGRTSFGLGFLWPQRASTLRLPTDVFPGTKQKGNRQFHPFKANACSLKRSRPAREKKRRPSQRYKAACDRDNGCETVGFERGRKKDWGKTKKNGPRSVRFYSTS